MSNPLAHVASRRSELLSPEAREELSAFKERLSGLGASTRHAYAWGARELLLFAERRGLSLDRLGLHDWNAFEEEIRGRGRPWLTGALSGARRFLREHAGAGGAIDESLLPCVTARDFRARSSLEAARDPRQVGILREAFAFVRERALRGYRDSANARAGALALLRFLLRRKKTLACMTASDWKDFSREATRGTRYKDAAPLLVGASAYLRLKVEQGLLARSPVPPRERPRAAPPSLPEDLSRSLEALEAGMAAEDLAEGTRRSYRRAVWALLAWASGEHGVLRLSDLTRDTLTAYRLRLQSEPSRKGSAYSLSSQIGALAALRFFFSWLVRTDRLLTDPTRHLPYPRPPRYLPRTLQVAEIARLIRSLPQDTLGLRDRAIVELLYGTGMRRSELARLDLADLDLESRQLLVRQGKGRKDRALPLGRKAKQALLDYLERSRARLLRGADPGALFLARDGRRLGKGQVADRLRELGRKVHLKLAPHLLRHSCATHLLRGRADIRHIQRLLGHESLQTTERYTKVELADLRSVIDRCHPREKEK